MSRMPWANLSAKIETGFISHKGQAHRLIEAGSEYQTDGSFVFIHGLFAAADVYIPLFEMLGQVAHCVAIDLPGHGKYSGKNLEKEEFSLDVLTDTLTEIMAKRRLQNICLAGHSAGGLLASKLALREPSIQRLILMNSTGFSPVVPESLMSLRQNPELIHSQAVLSNLKEALEIYESAKILQAYLDKFVVRQSSQYLLESLIESDTQAYTIPQEDLKQFGIPILLLWGEGDESVPDTTKLLLDTIPDCRLLYMDLSLYNPHVPFRRNMDTSRALLGFRAGILPTKEIKRICLNTDWNGDYPV